MSHGDINDDYEGPSTYVDHWRDLKINGDLESRAREFCVEPNVILPGLFSWQRL